MSTVTLIWRVFKAFCGTIAVPFIMGLVCYHQGRADGFERGMHAGVEAAGAVAVATIRNATR